jgi:TPR repeat protein
MKLPATTILAALALVTLSAACGGSPAKTPDDAAPAPPAAEPAPAAAPPAESSGATAAEPKGPALTCDAKACADEADKLAEEVSAKLMAAGEKEIDVAADEMRIAALYRRACEGKVPRACYQVFELDRRDAKIPQEKLAELLILACDGKVGSACGFLAAAYRDGKGVAKDHDKEVQALVSACTLTIYTQCKLVHDLAKTPSEKIAVAAVAKWKKDCAAGDTNACTSAKTK